MNFFFSFLFFSFKDGIYTVSDFQRLSKDSRSLTRQVQFMPAKRNKNRVLAKTFSRGNQSLQKFVGAVNESFLLVVHIRTYIRTYLLYIRRLFHWPTDSSHFLFTVSTLSKQSAYIIYHGSSLIWIFSFSPSE